MSTILRKRVAIIGTNGLLFRVIRRVQSQFVRFFHEMSTVQFVKSNRAFPTCKANIYLSVRLFFVGLCGNLLPQFTQPLHHNTEVDFLGFCVDRSPLHYIAIISIGSGLYPLLLLHSIINDSYNTSKAVRCSVAMHPHDCTWQRDGSTWSRRTSKDEHKVHEH